MPYIKQSMRPPYNALANTLISEMMVNGNVSEALIKQISRTLAAEKLEDIDGCLNYFITRLLKTLSLHKAPAAYSEPCAGYGTPLGDSMQADVLEIEEALFKLFVDLYPRKYFHFNRAGGVLLWCRKEFERRYGSSCCSTILTETADRLYRDPIGPYEDEKIKENGDV